MIMTNMKLKKSKANRTDPAHFTVYKLKEGWKIEYLNIIPRKQLMH